MMRYHKIDEKKVGQIIDNNNNNDNIKYVDDNTTV